MMNTATHTKIFQIQEKKKSGQPISALTAYDYPQALLVDQAGIDVLLVGDSLGNVVLGRSGTLEVTIGEMIHHLKAVVKAEPRALLVADMPVGSYQNESMALESAHRLVEAGAEAVKLEGGKTVAGAIESITGAGIPLMGHAGLLPQTAHLDGGYRIKGKTDDESTMIMEDVKAIEKAGAFAVVLELVTKDLSARITRSCGIPTIGIGSGSGCDGQILVLHDLLGFGPGPFPKHASPPVHYFDLMKKTVVEWRNSLPVPVPPAE